MTNVVTNQETFDTVVAHLRKQGKKALDDRCKCVYRAPDGSQCAAGCLLSDDEYRPSFETQAVTHTTDVGQLLEAKGYSLSLLLALQKTHDGLEVNEWEDQFKYIATTYGLEYKAA